MMSSDWLFSAHKGEKKHVFTTMWPNRAGGVSGRDAEVCWPEKYPTTFLEKKEGKSVPNR
jgi:hypothetical protein